MPIHRRDAESAENTENGSEHGGRSPSCARMHKAEPYATEATDARQGAKTQRRTVLSSWRALRLSERIAFLHGFPGCGCLLIFPADDVGIDPFAAGLAIGTEADDLGFVGLMLAGEAGGTSSRSGPASHWMTLAMVRPLVERHSRLRPAAFNFSASAWSSAPAPA